MKRWLAWLYGCVVAFWLVGALVLPVAALNVPAAPSTTAIADTAGIIDDTTEAALSQKLTQYKQQTGNEIAVLTIKSLEGDDIFDYSQRVFQTWGVGNKTANNGVLLVVALNDHKLRIHTGRGIEPYLTDLQCNLIITQTITPAFKKDDYSGGIAQGVDQIIAVIGGERLSPTSTAPKLPSWVDGLSGALPFIIFGLIYLASFLARSKSWWAGGVFGAVPGLLTLPRSLIGGAAVLAGGVGLGLLLDYVLSRNYVQRVSSGRRTDWWGSGGGFFGGSGGFSGGGGGFGGFSGGSSGGGGSSGSW